MFHEHKESDISVNRTCELLITPTNAQNSGIENVLITQNNVHYKNEKTKSVFL
jgi:hypothetical protein